jgi:hypothetical protein
MWPVSEKFREVITGGHTVAQKIELLAGGEVVLDLTDQGVVVDGNVVGARAAVQRSGSCTLVDPEGILLPGQGTLSSRLLAPAGNELRLWRGIAYHDTDPELVPVGTLRFVTNEVEAPRMALELYDRAWAIAGAGFTGVVTIAQGTPVVTAVRRLLQVAWGPGLPMNFPDADETTNSMTFEPGTDPWKVCQDLAANIGMRLAFDPMGVATMTPEPDPLLDPIVWSFVDTDPTNMALPGMRVRWEGTSPNLIVVVGENTDNDTVHRGVAIDTDPNSLTRYGGPYGKRHAEIRDEKVASKVQATFRARTELARQAGLITQPSLPILPHPALEIGDILLAVSPTRGFGQLCVLDGFSLPLRAASAMTIDCRERHLTQVSAA